MDYKKYLLVLLLIILAFNSVDRLALGLFLQDIKADLHVSDTQLGLLTGFAFALFYSAMGIPIARWADRGNRVVIISATIAFWSVMVALCAAAKSFVQLLLIRVGVAVGEAGCVPTSHSLIADYFGRSERPRALALYMLGPPLSVILGYFVAGWLNEFYGWRTTFVILGAPGALLAALAWYGLKEPRRHRLLPSSVLGSNLPPEPSSAQTGLDPLSISPRHTLREVYATLWANVTFRRLLFSTSIVSFFGYGIMQWQPAFFERSFGLSTGLLGTWFAGVYGIGGSVGTYLGGELATRYAANNERLQMRVMALLYAGFGLVAALIYLSRSPYVAFGLLVLSAVGSAMTTGPMFASIQTLVPERMRATAIAMVMFLANLIGMGAGPLLAGVLSDALRPVAGEESLRYALLLLCPGYVWGGWFVWCASASVTRDLPSREQVELAGKPTEIVQGVGSSPSRYREISPVK